MKKRRKKGQFKPHDLATRLRRQNRMTKEELLDYYQITKRSARIHKDRSKFDKKKSRQERFDYEGDQ